MPFLAIAASLLLVTIIFIFLRFSKLKVTMGEPPVGCLLVAYKYAYLERKGSALDKFKASFPSLNLVKFCYCGVKAKSVEYANGVILREGTGTEIESDMLYLTFKQGYSLFTTPQINHSVFIEVPIVSLIPLMHLLEVAVAYSRLFSYIEQRGLCGYPVVEVYRGRSLCIFVPLEQQDDFVVMEAVRVVHDLKTSPMLPPPRGLYTRQDSLIKKRFRQKRTEAGITSG